MLSLLLLGQMIFGFERAPISSASYLKFASQTEANQFFQSQGLGTVLSAQSSEQSRANQIMMKVWAVAKKLLPDLASGTAPHVVVYKSNKEVASVLPGPNGTVLYAILVSQPMMERSDSYIAFVLSHELSHVLFKQARPIRGGVIAAYREHQFNKMPLGQIPPDDASLFASVERVSMMTRLIGNYGDQLPGPAVLGDDAFLGVLVKYLIREKGSGKMACSAADSARLTSKLVDKSYDSFELTLNWASTELEATKSAIDIFNRNFLACANEQITISELIRDFKSQRAATLDWYPPSELEKLLASAATIGEKILGAISYYQKARQEIVSQGLLTDVRTYTVEDHADDVAAAFAKELGISTASYADTLIETTGKPADRAACRAKLASGQIPDMGRVSDLHHAPCYHIYRLKKLGEI